MNHHAHDRCRELLEQLSTYVDGELGGAERRTLRAHLKNCPCCQSMAESLQHTVEACRKAKTARLPADVRARARARIATLLATGPSRRRT
jgi:anti-sigma factor RsiW